MSTLRGWGGGSGSSIQRLWLVLWEVLHHQAVDAVLETEEKRTRADSNDDGRRYAHVIQYFHNVHHGCVDEKECAFPSSRRHGDSDGDSRKRVGDVRFVTLLTFA